MIGSDLIGVGGSANELKTLNGNSMLKLRDDSVFFIVPTEGIL